MSASLETKLCKIYYEGTELEYFFQVIDIFTKKICLKGLKTNVKMLLEEGNTTKTEIAPNNEDSSNRKRSSSLTEQVMY